jgi:hypothetical protein
MVSQLPRKHNQHHDAGGGALFTVRGGCMTGFGWCPPTLTLELNNFPSFAEISLHSVTPEVLRAVADELEARLARVPDGQAAPAVGR